MRVLSFTAICLIAVAAFLLFTQQAFSMEEQAEKPAYKQGEIIVKFNKKVAQTLKNELSRGKFPRELKMSASLDELTRRHKVKKMKPLIKQRKAGRRRTGELFGKNKAGSTKSEKHLLRRLKRAPKNTKAPELDRIYKIELADGQSAEQAVPEYQKNPDVEYAELNYIVRTAESPNDPYYNVQWALNNTGQLYPVSGGGSDYGTVNADINAPEAWDIYIGSSDIIVAVIDSGVDYTHRDLVGNMWTDANGNFGIDYVNGDDDPMDDLGHGTHCAGIIASRANNGTDTAGVCWNAKIMALKFINTNNQGYTSDAASAIYYAVDNGADILSNSWGGYYYSETLKDAVDYAHSQGVVIVAAAGNDNSSSPSYPAHYDNVISIAATDSNDQKASFSNYGQWIDIAAPGVDILSLRAKNTDIYLGTAGYTPGDRFVPFGDPNATMYICSGTSMACPYVAGACCLLLSVNPFLTTEDVNDILADTADPIADGICYSDGRLNLFAALTQAIQSASKGHIALDNDYYSCDSNIALLLTDSDLAGQGVCSISITTTGGDSETVILTEETPPVGAFTGTAYAVAGEPNIEDGWLQVINGDTIYAAYYDANDGTGNPAEATDSSTVDCVPPVISNVQTDVRASELTVTFNSDEPASAKVFCGQTCGGPYNLQAQCAGLKINHNIELSPLLQYTTYYFIVTAADAAGNQTVDSNSGSCYSFTTTGPNNIYVPAQYSTIQDGIDHAWPGSTIWVADGVYTGNGNRDIDFTAKALTVKSENGPENCIIDCQADANNPHRGFRFKSYEDINSIIDGFTITNGYGPSDYWDGFSFIPAGGAISCYHSSPTIKNCIITANRTATSPESLGGFGGGICCESSNPIISNCKITNNISGQAPGGGIFGSDTNISITGCEISGNYGGHGCGIYIEHGSPVIDKCTISNNTSGGATLGSLYLGWGTSQKITNCIITKNTASPAGICCWSQQSNATIRNCTIVDNSPAEWGGAIYFRGPAMVTNCICRNNHQPNLSGGLREIYGDLTVNYTNIQDNGDPADANYVAGTGNIDADPCFADPCNGDYHLKSAGWRWDTQRNAWTWDDVTSRCIDAGNPASPLADEPTSIPDDPNNQWGQNLRINMGAFAGTAQASIPPYDWTLLADLTNDGLVDLADFAYQAAGWLTSEDTQPGDLNRDGLIDISDLTLLAESWLEQTTWHQ